MDLLTQKASLWMSLRLSPADDLMLSLPDAGISPAMSNLGGRLLEQSTWHIRIGHLPRIFDLIKFRHVMAG